MERVEQIWDGLSEEEQNNVLAGKPVPGVTENEAEAIRRWLNWTPEDEEIVGTPYYIRNRERFLDGLSKLREFFGGVVSGAASGSVGAFASGGDGLVDGVRAVDASYGAKNREFFVEAIEAIKDFSIRETTSGSTTDQFLASLAERIGWDEETQEFNYYNKQVVDGVITGVSDLASWFAEGLPYSRDGYAARNRERFVDGLNQIADAFSGSENLSDIDSLVRTFIDDIDIQRNALEEERKDLEEQVFVGSEYGVRADAPHKEYWVSLNNFVDVLNQQGATVNGQRVTVEDLVSTDKLIRLDNFQRGNFEIKGIRTLTGTTLLDELSDADFSMHPGFGLYTSAAESTEALEEITEDIKSYAGQQVFGPDQQDRLSAVERKLFLLEGTKDSLYRSLGFDEQGRQVQTSDEIKLSAALNALAELDDVADFGYLASPLESLRQEIAPQLPAISLSENPELSAALRNQTSVSADAQRAAASRDLGQATTQFQGPPSEFGTRQQPALTNQPSADEQRAQFMAATAQAPTAEAPNEIDVELAKQMVEAAGFKVIAPSGTAPSSVSPGQPTGGVPTTTRPAAADMSEVQRLLIERFGGITFFLDKYSQELQVGVTADGTAVPKDDPRAERVMNVVDMMVEYGVVDPNQVLKVVQQTSWYQTTDNAMRRHDALMANMTDLEKKEYFDPVLDQLRDEAVFLGVSLSDELAMQMANDILYLGEADDVDFIRQTLVTQGAYDLSVVQGSSFAAITDSLVSLSKNYYTPIGTADASTLAQDIYFGNKTVEGVEQMFKEQAEAAFPMLANALAAGITPQQYFSPYKYELERILGRPNIDLYEEFPEVVSHIGENGEMRPMTLNEVRRFARGLPEWQESPQGIDAAYALTFAIGEVFGEVA